MNLETSSPRRDFLRATALAGGGLVIGFLVPGARRFAMAQEATAAAPTTFVPNAFLSIAADDTITVQLAHAEMGQGIWTTLPMLIAEELDADWSKIRVEHGAADKAYTSPVFGMQGTGGSTTLLDRDGDIISMDFTGHQHILAQDVIQRLQQFSNSTCPAPQCGTAQLHSLTTVYF